MPLKVFPVWGDRVYSDNSVVCLAAVHAGVIRYDAGGTVTIEISPGRDHYAGRSSHGITSASRGAWPGSFFFVEDDSSAPVVHALPSRGEAGERVAFRFTATDDSGETSERLTIYDRQKGPAHSAWTKFSPSVQGKIYGFNVQADKEDVGTTRFCVEAKDRSGNVSKPSCAEMVIS